MQDKKPQTAKELYNNRIKHQSKTAQEYLKKANKTSNLRLLTALIGIAGAIYLYMSANIFASIAILAIFLIIFVILVAKHRQFQDKRTHALILSQINEEAILRSNGNWDSFEDKGSEFIDEEHPYTHDLDIFGQGSLFQWINTTTTFNGRKKLKELLKKPCEKIEDIHNRQEAIEELSKKLKWRQELMTEGRKINDKDNKKTSLQNKNTEKLFSWAKNQNKIYLYPFVNLAVKVLPLITIALLLSAFFTDMSYFFPAVMIALHIGILVYDYSRRINDFMAITAYIDILKGYKKMLGLVESENFKSKPLKKLQFTLNSLTNTNHNKKINASQQINQLEKIVDAISHRFNQLYLVFNILFLLDYRWQIALEKWKKQSGKDIELWFNILGEIEALSSLSNINFDNPDWVMPEITGEPKFFEAEDLGHPLITENRVCNNLELKKPVNTLLITGSNMSGKSTLLRTAGINLVMAYIGAPICAKSFKASLMNVYTCMRISDNLEKNISSFYAELLRIKSIIKLAEQEPVFYLLDEIFKGTNSWDRHTGAKAVIKKLQREDAIGLVSTHDLELGNLEKEQSELKNYHFREYYQNDEIKFDYILRKGLSPTTNAAYLMKLAGIEPETNSN
ncbi:MutS family DNA mismatch repair protein [Natranaerofaba carboxydovora]|uniref:MutS family DNA mismatch repair protein n=1 Tax=Natranaerofaba carboxydovora TaxID=2742683 RepID=UPI001F13DF28|nr:MutS family DNA mismatch repair protein [Natranaerofaba carboxydovora]UMZ72500.1 DNA mismatch repair protein MutS [Natranaerofaba carboxydovora]